ncbi:glucokinase [Cupriavidus oxalaticus]|jgi:glucokinase|nr:glucokinase [Cupriavidus oxalaticus]QEZ44041.1 glucokinase [Cupriavidus oxalaticus]QRQ84550.1 glucokinase [Cupriavidus oxalaticus]QRQ91361.1 glucokinase [Cupriavidus oxalaticus]WQD85920.1 glucokinase [Cupriavidus oxalaticus]
MADTASTPTTTTATTTATFPRLLGDVGGTNVRFALETAPMQIGPVSALKVADFPSLEAALRQFLDGLAGTGQPLPRHAAIGLANPVTGDQVRLTNHNWSFSIDGMRRALGLQTLVALNDFTALALALPHLPGDGLVQVRAGTAVQSAPLALVGPGTGLGVSGLVPVPGGQRVALAGEGGHIELMPATDDEWVAWRAAHRQLGRVSAERLLSGAGLSQIHAALAAETGTLLLAPLQPEQVTDGAFQRNDPLCQRTMTVFFGLLGSVAADIALVLGARGGVYLGGGILPRFVPALQASAFAERFVAKGRMRGWLEDVPVHVITARHPALPGLARALAERLDREAGNA